MFISHVGAADSESWTRVARGIFSHPQIAARGTSALAKNSTLPLRVYILSEDLLWTDVLIYPERITC